MTTQLVDPFITLTIRRKWYILATAIVLLAVAGVLGAGLATELKSGGYVTPDSESSRASKLLSEKFGAGDTDLVLSVRTTDGVTSQASRSWGLGLVDRLVRSRGVVTVSSPWTVPGPQVPDLVSADGRTGLVVIGLRGDEDVAQKHAWPIADQESGQHGTITVAAGGAVMMALQATEQSQTDLIRAESIAVPLTLLALIWVFGGLVAACVPLVVGMFTAVGTLAILRAVTVVTDVSIFALNLTTVLAFGFAVDYSLLLITRYREEFSSTSSHEEAMSRTIRSAGKTVLFSSVTVAICLLPMALFPTYFLRSFGYAGTAVAAFAGAASMALVPALVAVLGPWINAGDLRKVLRRNVGFTTTPNVEQTRWYRWARFVTHNPWLAGGATLLLLFVLGLPFLRVDLAGYVDERSLPSNLSARQVGDDMRTNFPAAASSLRITLASDHGISSPQVDGYATAISRLAGVSSVSSPDGVYRDGRRGGAPAAPASINGDTAFLTATVTTDAISSQARTLLDDIHRVPTPPGARVAVAGPAQVNRDSTSVVEQNLPWVLGVIAVVTFALLSVLTKSVVLPVKALLMNALSLSATFGSLVWVFQEGHLHALGTTPTGSVMVSVVTLLFCLSFGISMDYEVFVLSRIREYWLRTGPTQGNNEESVVYGLARSGGVVTAAAALMTIVLIAFASSEVSLLRMLGLGIAVAIIVDATLVRSVLVPAFMRVVGRYNWWLPGLRATERVEQR